jgi:trimethylamine--corrinoid protein Co-methyltransferase
MTDNGKKKSTPRFPGGLEGGSFRPLGDDDIGKIHEGTVEVLSEVGFEVRSEEAFDLFREAGAEVDDEKMLVRVSEDLLMDLVGRAPKEFTLHGREERHDLHIGGKRVYMGTGGTALNILDADTEECRRAKLQDLIDIIRLVDGLDNVHFMLLPTYPADLPLENVDENRFFAGLSCTTKHVMGGVYTAEGISNVIRMAEEVAGSPEELRRRPFISMIACGISPLRLDRKYGDFMIQIAREDIPVAVPVEPLCGATSPVTLAGNLIIQNCDGLISLMATQLARPGARAIYGCVGTSTDLRDLKYLGGSVESGLINAATAQLAQFYDLPYYSTAGISDSKTIDAQCGYEAAVNNLLVSLAGANLIHDAAGLMEFAMTVCKEKYVIDNEIIGMAMRAVHGIDVDDATMALRTIKRVGPGGHFVSARHTRRHMKKEHYQPALSDRDSRRRWEANGRADTLQRASEQVEDILGNDVSFALGDDMREKLLHDFPNLSRGHYEGEESPEKLRRRSARGGDEMDRLLAGAGRRRLR